MMMNAQSSGVRLKFKEQVLKIINVFVGIIAMRSNARKPID